MADWHPERIKAEIRIKGENMSRIAARLGVVKQNVSGTLRSPNARVEREIAKVIGVPPHQIWPSRYDANGRRKSPQPAANYTYHQTFASDAA